MKHLILFNKKQWSAADVREFIISINGKINFVLRNGFNHILAICDSEIDIQKSPREGTIYSFEYDREKNEASSEVKTINRNGIINENLEGLSKTVDNFLFDLTSFGYIPDSVGIIEDLYLIIKESRIAKEVPVICTDESNNAINNSNIPPDIKKSLLDYCSLRACAALLLQKFHDANEQINQYATAYLMSVITRSQYEKLILLTAKIDNSLDHDKLIGAKKMKKNFIKQANQSTQNNTKNLLQLVKNLEILDDDYRTPETHKSGRLLKLISDDHYGSLINEIMSFQNDADAYFRKICTEINNEYKDC